MPWVRGRQTRAEGSNPARLLVLPFYQDAVAPVPFWAVRGRCGPAKAASGRRDGDSVTPRLKTLALSLSPKTYLLVPALYLYMVLLAGRASLPARINSP